MSKDEINIKLIDTYGLDISGQPRYRVVWSNDETEVRVGTFNEFYGDIFVRTTSGAKQVPKYNYLDNRWILEVLIPTNNPELLTKMSYEPLYVFENRKREYLPLNWDAITAVINTIQNRERKPAKTEKQEWDDETADFEREKKRNLDYLNAIGRTNLQQKFQDGTAVVNPLEKKNE